MSQFDCVVVGSGPGGYVGALRAAQLGMRTAIVERESIGGRCLNQACIPAKAVLRTADVLDAVRRANTYGVLVDEPKLDLAGVKAWRDNVVSRLSNGVSGLLRKAGVEVLTGEARLTESGVALNARSIEAGATVLATGSARSELPGLSFGGRVVGTEEAWSLDHLPARMAIIGAGPSGVELASAYARMGSTVLLIEREPQLLPGEDLDSARVLTRELRQQGVEVFTGKELHAASQVEKGVELSVEGSTRVVDLVVVSVGRRPDLVALQLDKRFARESDGRLSVDEHQRTSVHNVFAVGDLVAGPALAHKASEEALVAVEAAAGDQPDGLDRSLVPRITFSSPPVASMGLSEAAARELGHEVTVGKVPYGAVGAGSLLEARNGLVKLVAEAQTGALLGAHIVGPRAPELLQELVLARALHGGVGDIARVVHGHPTLSEAVQEAARAADGWLIHG